MTVNLVTEGAPVWHHLQCTEELDLLEILSRLLIEILYILFQFGHSAFQVDDAGPSLSIKIRLLRAGAW